MSYPENQRSLWWVLLPIFLAIFGGIIAYFALHRDDIKLAKFCLHLSIVLTIINILQVIVVITLLGSGTESGLGVNI